MTLANMDDECPFCQIVQGLAPAHVIREWDEIIAIAPLNPVTPGHILVLPKEHVEDFTTSYHLTGIAARCAAGLARDFRLPDANLITSKGTAATQSVFHLHFHLVPRRENDGLALPWYSGRRKNTTLTDADVIVPG